MNIPIYKFYGPITEYRYEFLSISIEKKVIKVVRFSETDTEEIYNLVLLDIMPDGSESNDKTETKNKDMETILATVIAIITSFLHKNPTWFVHIEGSDIKRKRVYQILINREYDNLITDYVIFGGNGEERKVFEKGKNYQYFIITKR